MRVPRDSEGRPRFSISQFRTYGAADLVLDQHEDDRGCPRLYKRKYVDHDIPGEIRSPYLLLGRVLHEALHVMERDAVGPEEALQLVWSAKLPERAWKEAKGTLLRYLDRGGPMAMYATLAHELDLTAQLYVDEDFGPVMMRGIIDWIGLDPLDQGLLHIVDYKNNQAPPKRDVLQGDVQLKTYDWLTRMNWDRWLPGLPPRTVVHLDVLRYRDVEVRYSEAELEEWLAWAEAVARKILRDEEGKPSLNPGCAWCPVSHDCPAYQGLPGVAKGVALRRTGKTPEQVWAWRNELWRVRKLVEKALKDAEAQLEAEVEPAGGVLEFGNQRWRLDVGWESEVDWPRLHDLLGARFWSAVSTSKTAIDRATEGMDESTRAMARACVASHPAGTRIKKETV